MIMEQEQTHSVESNEADRQRRLYETILSNTPDLVYVFGLDHRFVYANAALLSMWGRSWDDSIGKNCLELGYEPWHAEMHDREIEQVIATKRPIRGVVPFNGTNGRRIYDYIFTPVIGAEGEVEAIAGTTRDITERIAWEEALKESEARYRTLFESIDEGFCVVQMIHDGSGRAVDYRFIEANPAFEHHTGFSNVRGKLQGDIQEGIEPFWFDLYAKVALTGQPERLVQYSERLERWFDLYVFRVAGPDDQKVAILFRDITARRRHEAHLAFLADVGQDFARLSSAGEIMEAVGAKIGNYLELAGCNFCQIDEEADLLSTSYGWNRNDFPSLLRTYRISEYLGSEFTRASREGETVVIRDTQNDSRVDPESYSRLGVGSLVTVPFHRNGRWTHLLALVDVRPRDWREDEIELFQELSNRIFPRLERAEAEEALRESEERFRMAGDAVTGIVFDWDIRSGVVWRSGGLERVLGYGARESQSTLEWWTSLIHPDDRSSLAFLAPELIQRDGPKHYEGEYRIRHRDGHWVHLWERGFVLRDDTGNVLRMVGTATDITERKQVEEELESRVAQRTEELVAKNQELEGFTYSISHDMRAPLRAIVANARITLEEERSNLSEDGKRNLERLSSAALKMARLVDDLLEYARLGTRTLRIERTNLSDLLRRAAIDVEVDYPGCTLQLSIPDEVVANCDPRLVGMALHNLLDNACKYRKPGEPARVEFSVRDDGGERVYCLCDDGIGFDMAYAQKLFMPFERLHRESEYPGTGIGLANVRRALERHGGRIWAESQPNRGARFYFTLPDAT